LVNLGLKGAFDLRGGAIHGDPVSAARNSGDAQPVSLQPSLDLAQIAIAHPKSLGVLFRREPSPVIGRSRILLRGQQLREIRLLPGSLPQFHRNVGHRLRCRHAPLVACRERQRMKVPSQGNPVRLIEGTGDPVGLRSTDL
jgi:hypothetical protein